MVHELSCPEARGTLVPRPGIEHVPCIGWWIPKHWTTGKSPETLFLFAASSLGALNKVGDMTGVTINIGGWGPGARRVSPTFDSLIELVNTNSVWRRRLFKFSERMELWTGGCGSAPQKLLDFGQHFPFVSKKIGWDSL